MSSKTVFMSTLLSQPNKVGLKCPPVCPYVRICPSVHKTFFDFNEIWHVGRVR